MGRIAKAKVLPMSEIVRSTVDTYIKDSTQTYPEFLNEAPLFVTYYSRNLYESTYDTSFEAYNEIVGEESPNKFHKIENLPIYSLDTGDFGKTLNDDGWTGELQSSCIILPNTVTPKPDDLMEIEIHSKKYLFQVINGSSDNYGNTKFYKLEIRISNYRKDEAERQTTEELEVNFDLIGKVDNVVVKKSLNKYIETLREKYDHILKVYRENSFDKILNFFIEKDLSLLDYNLNKFIRDNELNKPFLEYRNSTAISGSLDKYVKLSTFDRSFFGNLSNGSEMKLHEVSFFVVMYPLSLTKYSTSYFAGTTINIATYENVPKDIFFSYEFNLSKLSSEDYNSIFIERCLTFLINEKEKNNLQYLEDSILPLIPKLQPEYEGAREGITNKSDLISYYKNPLILFCLKEIFYIITSS